MTKVENRFNSSRVVDGIRHRHAERLRILQGIDRELWQRPSSSSGYRSTPWPLTCSSDVVAARCKRAMSRDTDLTCWFPSSNKSLGCAAAMPGRWSLWRRSSPPARDIYAATHFAITTDINKLISPDLDVAPARTGLREGVPRLFRLDPGGGRCADAGACDRGERQAGGAAERSGPTCFMSVRQLDGDPFFAKNGLLFQPEAELARHGTRARPRRSDHRRSGRRPVASRTDAGAFVRPARRANRPGQARRPATRVDHVVGHHRSGDGRAAGELFVARADDRAEARSRASFATSSMSSRCWISPRCSPARPQPMRSAKRRPT